MKKLLVCSGPYCAFRGADRVFETLKNFFTGNEGVAVLRGACTGFCEEGPNVVEDEKIIYYQAKPKDIGERIERQDGKPLVRITEESIKLDDAFLGL